MADARDLKSLDRKVMRVRLPPSAPLKKGKEMSEKDFIKQAEQKALNKSRYYSDVFRIFDALQRFGNHALHEHIAKKEFFKGLSQLPTNKFVGFLTQQDEDICPKCGHFTIFSVPSKTF